MLHGSARQSGCNTAKYSVDGVVSLSLRTGVPTQATDSRSSEKVLQRQLQPGIMRFRRFENSRLQARLKIRVALESKPLSSPTSTSNHIINNCAMDFDPELMDAAMSRAMGGFEMSYHSRIRDAYSDTVHQPAPRRIQVSRPSHVMIQMLPQDATVEAEPAFRVDFTLQHGTLVADLKHRIQETRPALDAMKQILSIEHAAEGLETLHITLADACSLGFYEIVEGSVIELTLRAETELARMDPEVDELPREATYALDADAFADEAKAASLASNLTLPCHPHSLAKGSSTFLNMTVPLLRDKKNIDWVHAAYFALGLKSAGFNCDVCKVKYDLRRVTFRCKECDFDCCLQCAQKQLLE